MIVSYKEIWKITGTVYLAWSVCKGIDHSVSNQLYKADFMKKLFEKGSEI